MMLVLAALFAISAWLGRKLASQILDMEGAVNAERLAASSATAGSILAMADIDLHGRIFNRIAPGTKRIVAFGLSGPDLRARIALWQQVYANAPAGTAFIGMCADSRCAEFTHALQPTFTVLVAGEATGLFTVQRANLAGSFLVTDDESRILAEAELAGHNSAAVLAEIEGAR